MPGASGEAKVESKRGTMEIKAEFSGPRKTHLFWHGVSHLRPVGDFSRRPSRERGEVLVGDNHRSKLDVTTDLQAFALIVTAEPYYAVRVPATSWSAENEIRPDTVGTSEAVDAKYELIDRGGYIPTGLSLRPCCFECQICRSNSLKRAMPCASPNRPEPRTTQTPATKMPCTR